jgi:hypothetical protein
MRKTAGLLFAAALIISGSAQTTAQPLAQPVAQPPGQDADVVFGDGSSVRITMHSENVELLTKYGKLTIPTNEIRRVEFAFRIDEDLAKRVSAALNNLRSKDFKVREAGQRELFSIGLPAFPQIEIAATDDDPEVKRRAEAIVAEFRERYGPDRLVFPKKDSVETVEFSAVGHVASPTLKVKTAYFGNVELKTADIRTITWIARAGDFRLVVDAARHGSANDQWMDTGVKIDRDVRMKMTVRGQIDLWPQGPGQYMSTPKGYGNARPPLNFPSGILVARIGEFGKPFMIGEEWTGRSNESGNLFFHIVPSPWNNASTGSYDVRLTVGGR